MELLDSDPKAVLSQHQQTITQIQHQLEGVPLNDLANRRQELLYSLNIARLGLTVAEEQDRIDKSNALSDYYCCFYLLFVSVLTACRALKSKWIEAAKFVPSSAGKGEDSQLLHYVAKGASSLHEIGQDIPGLSLITRLIDKVGQVVALPEKVKIIKAVARLVHPSVKLETFAELLSRRMTLFKHSDIMAECKEEKCGFVKRHYRKMMKKVKATFNIDDIDTPVKKLAERDTDRMLKRIFSGKVKSAMTLSDVDELLVSAYPNYASFARTNRVSLQSKSAHVIVSAISPASESDNTATIAELRKQLAVMQHKQEAQQRKHEDQRRRQEAQRRDQAKRDKEQADLMKTLIQKMQQLEHNQDATQEFGNSSAQLRISRSSAAKSSAQISHDVKEQGDMKEALAAVGRDVEQMKEILGVNVTSESDLPTKAFTPQQRQALFENQQRDFT